MEPYQKFNLYMQIALPGAQVFVTTLHEFPDRQPTNNHKHSGLELHYNTSGTSLFSLNFQRHMVVQEGQWILLGQNTFHEETIAESCAGFTLNLQLREAEPSSPFTDWETLYYQICAAERDDTVGALLSCLYQELQKRQYGYQECCRHIVSLLLIHLSRCGRNDNFGSSDVLPREDTRILIDNFFNRVFNEQREGLTLENLAESLHVSTRHVNRILQTYYGMTFREMLLSTRMRFTEYMLLHSDASTAEISDLCELSEPYLIRSFRETYGITPAQYRKLYRKDKV